MESFEKSSWVPVSPRELWRWHEDVDALAKLTPPWERIQIVSRTPAADGSALGEGARTTVRARVGTVWLTIEAVHGACEPGRVFTDSMTRGPFRHWRHEHRFEPETREGTLGTRMVDNISWRLPMAPLSHWLAGWAVRRRLRRLFEYRHQVLQELAEPQPTTDKP